MKHRFDKTKAGKQSGVELLAYLSNVVGEDDSLVQHGGGNSSFKAQSDDFLGNKLDVIHIKGSGSDMRTITAKDFVTLRLEDAKCLSRARLKTDAEMMDFMDRCLLDPTVIRSGGSRPSVETPLHVLVDAPWVLHTHDYATEALTNTTRGRKIIEEVYGKEMVFVPYARPGLPLAMSVSGIDSGAGKGLVLSNHGLVVWGGTARECYDNLHWAINKAEEYIESRRKGRKLFPAARGLQNRARTARQLLPELRGELSRASGAHVVLTYSDNQTVLDFVGSPKLREFVQRGMVTPEHVLRAGHRALVLDRGEDMKQALGAYAKAYRRYFETYSRGEQMLHPRPKVILIPGVGMVTAERDKLNSEIAADCYRHGIRVMAGAESIDEFRFLSDQDVFDFEYWELELLKLKKQPPELGGKIALVTGAAGGIGQAIAERLIVAGAHVVLSDVDKQVAEVAASLGSSHGRRVHSVVMDVGDERSVVEAFDQVVLHFGGLDILASNAGYLAADAAEDIFSLSGDEIRRHFNINAIGPMLVTREAAKIMQQQGTGGTIVFNASKAGYLAGKGLSSYGSAKAAEINFARAAAQELGPLGIRVNYVNADMVDTPMFRKLLKRRAKDSGVDENEQMQKYLARKVLAGGGFIPPEYVAEAFLFFASDRSKFTTGSVLTVDRGLPEAFPR